METYVISTRDIRRFPYDCKITAAKSDLVNGWLVLKDSVGNLVAAFAPTEWLSCKRREHVEA